MTRVSQGEARPSLPRASELPALESVPDRSVGRGEAGRFGAGNQAAIGNRAKGVVRRALGKDLGGPIERQVYRDVTRMMRELLAGSPTAGPMVRMMASMVATHYVLAGLHLTRAMRAGLETEAGERLLDLHGEQSKRYERTNVSLAALMAQAQKTAPRRPADPLAAYRQRKTVTTGGRVIDADGQEDDE